MKKLAITCFTILISAFLYAQRMPAESVEYPWHLLEQGRIAYEEREFGQALLLFREAREMHKTQVQAQYDYLFSALKVHQVRAAGDLISDVYRVLEKRQDYEACAILDRIFLVHPPAYFDKSMSALLEWLKKSDVYPECDYLIGKVYELEGELTQSRRFYQLAWEAREFLYIPDMRFEIIYSLAQISGLLKQYDDQEKYLLLILTEDSVYGTTNAESPTLRAMIHTIKNEQTVEKFFSLYRHHNDIALRAYIELTDIYLRAEEYDRAFRTALLGADIAVTYLSDTLKKVDFMYRYSDFSDLLLRIGMNSEILQWTETKQIWNVFLQFADLLYRQGFVVQANDLYYKLAENCPSFTYAKEASYKLSQTF
ncbi:hypothetical protein E4N70_05620 [Treponema vincentii]|uniref:hypothetical protein n=1 Tax=Treponema vincentii TaxID=69710 RepID=UPI0020A5FC88|nr:hypothetical protein [Treponema vincentii]UTC61033.1 hypothetical protein E4N70_05620 [Treponema vincentii]